MNSTKHYAKRDPESQDAHYINHVYAMATEGLHATRRTSQLAHRDIEIERLRAQADERKAFEGWVAASGRAYMLKRDDRNDWYADLTVTAWWTAWQARAAQEGK